LLRAWWALFTPSAETYAYHTVRYYGQATLVFQWLWWRSLHKRQYTLETRKNLHPIISFTAETEISGKRVDFKSYDKNKADNHMIVLISTALTKRGCHIIQGMQMLRQLLNDPIIAPQRWSVSIQICWSFWCKRAVNWTHNVYNINLLKETLGDKVCNELLFVHASSGCDSTSTIFGIGKKSAYRKLVKSDPGMKSCSSPVLH
jgi:hypothetical protein